MPTLLKVLRPSRRAPRTYFSFRSELRYTHLSGIRTSSLPTHYGSTFPDIPLGALPVNTAVVVDQRMADADGTSFDSQVRAWPLAAKCILPVTVHTMESTNSFIHELLHVPTVRHIRTCMRGPQAETFAYIVDHTRTRRADVARRIFFATKRRVYYRNVVVRISDL